MNIHLTTGAATVFPWRLMSVVALVVSTAVIQPLAAADHLGLKSALKASVEAYYRYASATMDNAITAEQDLAAARQRLSLAMAALEMKNAEKLSVALFDLRDVGVLREAWQQVVSHVPNAEQWFVRIDVRDRSTQNGQIPTLYVWAGLKHKQTVHPVTIGRDTQLNIDIIWLEDGIVGYDQFIAARPSAYYAFVDGTILLFTDRLASIVKTLQQGISPLNNQNLGEIKQQIADHLDRVGAGDWRADASSWAMLFQFYVHLALRNKTPEEQAKLIELSCITYARSWLRDQLDEHLIWTLGEIGPSNDRREALFRVRARLLAAAEMPEPWFGLGTLASGAGGRLRLARISNTRKRYVS